MATAFYQVPRDEFILDLVDSKAVLLMTPNEAQQADGVEAIAVFYWSQEMQETAYSHLAVMRDEQELIDLIFHTCDLVQRSHRGSIRAWRFFTHYTVD